MAKHVISVCIFCLICATHTPCASHITNTKPHEALRLIEFDTPYKERLKPLPTISDNRNPNRSVVKRDLTVHNNNTNNSNSSNSDRDKVDLRNSNESTYELAQQYTKKLFSTYGNGDTMTLQGFERMVDHLGLVLQLPLKLDDELLDTKKIDYAVPVAVDDTKVVNKTCKFGRLMPVDREALTLLGCPSYNALAFTETERVENVAVAFCLIREIQQQGCVRIYLRPDVVVQCSASEELLKSLKTSFQTNPVMNNTTFQEVCPAILYGMIAKSCIDDDKNSLKTHLNVEEETNAFSMWAYSNIAVFIISACGVLGLAVIPITQKRFYEQLLQFLVALAVGTLAGDALLHLLPHAMTSSHHGDSAAGDHGHGHGVGENMNMWKGCVAMLGLVFFFFMERMIIIAAKWRKAKQLKDKLPKRLKVMNKEGSTQLTNASEKQCKHKYSSFPYCYDEIKMIDGPYDDRVFRLAGGTDSTVESRNNTQTTTLDDLASNSDIHSYKNANILHSDDLEANQNLTECPNDITSVTCTGKNKMLEIDNNKEDSDSLEYTVILREHESKHHGHTHAHGHVHAAPKTMFSVAWMVIMGDGLHNFTDGMAIGAAFSNSLAGGLSTAVAVFCHELPHELGDFAMLLKAGMSMKQALFYNLLSSVLCFFGNWVGLHLGNIEYASSWVFAMAAGMFLYIALVDMIPELSSGHEGEGTLFQCFLHLAGLLLGFGIMTLIAMYEHHFELAFQQ